MVIIQHIRGWAVGLSDRLTDRLAILQYLTLGGVLIMNGRETL